MDASVVSQNRVYGVTYDEAIRFSAFATGRLTDDSGMLLDDSAIDVSVDEPLLTANVVNHHYALSGNPSVALTDRNIAYNLAVAVTISGYRPLRQIVTVPANVPLPVVQPLAVRREPVSASGRVMRLADGTGVASARITISGPPLPVPQQAILLSQPLTADLSTGATLRGRTLVSRSAISVGKAGLAGDIEIEVSNRTGLAAGQLLRFGPAHHGFWGEIAQVAAIPPNPALPGIVRLTEALRNSVQAAMAVQVFDAGAFAGPVATPVGQAFAQEAVVIADAIPTGDVIVVRDPPASDRFHDRDILSNAEGDYLVQGLSRLKTFELRVSAAGFANQNRRIPASRIAHAPVDWQLTP
jgi:hypothetical protein